MKKKRCHFHTVLLKYLMKHHNGYKKAIHIKPLMSNMNCDMEERSFRSFLSDLREDKEIATSNRLGVWFVPLSTNDNLEIIAILDGYYTRQAHAKSELKGISRQIKILEESLQGQKVFA